MIDVTKALKEDEKRLVLNPHLAKYALLLATKYTNDILPGMMPELTVKKQCMNHGINYYDPGSITIETVYKIFEDLRRNCYAPFSIVMGDDGRGKYNDLLRLFYREVTPLISAPESEIVQKVSAKEQELNVLGIKTLDNVIEKKAEDPEMDAINAIVKKGAVRPIAYSAQKSNVKTPANLFPWQNGRSTTV